jgi:hypothetical protein
MFETIISNPEIVLFLLSLAVSALGWLFAKLLKLMNISWAEKYLGLAGSHALRAAEVAGQVYAHKLDIADNDGVVTQEERAEAWKEAKVAFWAAISPKELAKALKATKGLEQWMPQTAEQWGEELVKSAVNKVELAKNMSPTK